jgi:imidazolonepropionase-like amidohydrolase
MRDSRLVLTIVCGAITTLCLATREGFGQTADTKSQGLALVGAAIYVSPTAKPIQNGVVLIRSGKISGVGSRVALQVPATFQTLDCSGGTITAGFWNSHVHFFERKWINAATIPAAELTRQLRDMVTRYGFTDVFDLGSPWENTRRIRERIESGEVPGPRILSTGEVLIAPGAMPSNNILAVLGDMPLRNFEITSAAEAAETSKKVLGKGVDAIKVHLQPPPPPNPPFPADAILTAVTEAHRAGKPVFVHPNSGADVLAAARAGVDVIAHTTPQSGPWDDKTIMAMNDAQVALTPTLTLWKSSMRHDLISTQERYIRTAIGQLQAWATAGGTVLFGTDLGAIDYDPGEEYALMTEARMSFRQILASLTTAPAERFGESQRLGRIAAGLDADLVVLKGDPSRNVQGLADVEYTIRGGKIIYRSTE